MSDINDSKYSVAAQNWRAYERARDNGHTAYVKMARTCDDYYVGDQWDEKVKTELTNKGRPALTINEILPTVNTVVGEQTTKRADIQYKPANSGLQESAVALTKVAAAICDANKFDRKETRVFTDGLIQERGYFDIRMDWDDHIAGEIRINTLDPLDVVLDPDAKEYDPKTWKEVSVTRWYSLDDIEEEFGKEKAKELKNYAYTGGRTFGTDSIEMYESTFAGIGQTTFTDVEEINQTDDGKTIRRCRVIERQHRRLAKQKYFIDPNTGDMRKVPETWDEDRVAAFAQQMGLELTTKMVSKIRWTSSVDHIDLHDKWSPYQTFTIIPFFPFFRRGKPFGIVRNLLSPQDQLNKVSSQELHVVNTTANSGYYVEEGSLVNMEVGDLETKGAMTGLVIEYARGSQPPEKIQPNQIPTGLDRISAKSQNHIRNISGVNESLRGEDGSEVSGVAISKKQQSGLIQMEVPFDNLAFTRELVAEKILELVQQFYTEERLFHITNYSLPNRPMEELRVNEVTPEGRVINDLTIGEYGVVVTNSPARDTFEDGQFAEALQLRELGLAIPDDEIIMRSNLAQKNELAERVREISGLGEPSEEEMEAMALQQQIVIQTSMKQLEKLDAEVQELQARAMEQQAQAAMKMLEVQSGGLTPADMQAKMADLQADAQAKMAELRQKQQQSRDELAARLQIAQMNAVTQRAGNQMKLMESKMKAAESRQAKAKQ